MGKRGRFSTKGMHSIVIPIVLGSIRIGRQSCKVARSILSQMAADPRVKTEVLDLAEYEFPLMQERLSEMSIAPAAVQAFSDKLERADGVVIVSPEYKGGIPGVLKNAFDYLRPGILRRKPVGICTVSSGGFGGLNCLMQLRLTTLALGGVPIPDALPVSNVQQFFDEDGQPRDGTWSIKLGAFTQELLFYADALAQGRRCDGSRAEVGP
jgi:NAD(P)H-dependent FMN reductase